MISSNSNSSMTITPRKFLMLLCHHWLSLGKSFGHPYFHLLWCKEEEEEMGEKKEGRRRISSTTISVTTTTISATTRRAVVVSQRSTKVVCINGEIHVSLSMIFPRIQQQPLSLQNLCCHLLLLHHPPPLLLLLLWLQQHQRCQHQSRQQHRPSP